MSTTKTKHTWILTRKDGNEVIGEFYNYSNVLKFNPEKVIVETAYDYLCRINHQIKKGYEIYKMQL